MKALICLFYQFFSGIPLFWMFSLVFVLACRGCYNEIPQTGCKHLEKTETYFPLFCRLEVSDQGASVGVFW